MIDAACQLLVRIGTASQVIDDISGAFPGVLDDDKDTLGEIIHLRRTVPLVLLAHHDPHPEVRTLLTTPPPLGRDEALRLRDALWHSEVPRLATQLCERLLTDIDGQLGALRLGAATTAYLHDLVDSRLRGKINRIRAHISRTDTAEQ